MKKLLIVVDYQNDFVNGTLGFPHAQDLEMRICNKMEQYLAEQQEICFTLDTHRSDYLTTKEGIGLPIPHCILGTSGHDLFGKVQNYVSEHTKCFRKPTFGSAELFDFLRTNHYDSIELVGLVSNICVLTNAILAKTALPEADVVIDASCTDSSDKLLQEKAFDVLQGVMIHVNNRTKS